MDTMDYIKTKGMEEVEKLKTENQALKSLFEDSHEGIVMVDKNGYITMMNKTYTDFLNIKPEDAIGKDVRDVIENTRLDIVLKTGKEEISQIQRIKDNDCITLRIPIIRDNQVCGAIGKVIYKDISEAEGFCRMLDSTKEELNLYKERFNKVKGAYYSVDNIIGISKMILQLKHMVERVAKSDSTVLITGESGTGKEVFANAIHETSTRRDNNYIKVNCAAIPSNILESELFGYEEGAFTGAKKGGKIGKFELANGGTIFLDEIGDMSFDMQAKMLRVIQEKRVERVGGNDSKKIDVRIIAATNQDLVKKIKEGEFREDLFYRLNVVPFIIPPLRERPEDIPVLCDFFIKKYNNKFGIYIDGIDAEAMDILKKFPWFGNVRELENVIERIYNFIDEYTIQRKHLPKQVLNSENHFPKGKLRNILDEYEKQIIVTAFKTYEDNKSKVADELGISRATLYQKLKKYDIIN